MSWVLSLERVTLAAKHTYAWFGVRDPTVPDPVADADGVGDTSIHVPPVLHAVTGALALCARHCTLYVTPVTWLAGAVNATSREVVPLDEV